MRVLISTSTFPLQRDDGLPRFVYDLAEALAARCEVTVLAPGAPGIASRERWGPVEVRRFTYFRPPRWQRLAYGDGIGANLRSSWLSRLQPLPYLLAQVRATRSLVDAAGIEVVNSHWIVPQGLSTALARGRSARFRHVVTLHGGDAYLLRRLPFAQRLVRFILSRSDAVFAVSSNVRDQLDAALGRPSGALVQPVGVDVARFGEVAEAAGGKLPFPAGYLLYVGRLLEIKGVSDLLRAMPAVRARHPGVGLLVVGYGERESDLRREAERLGIAEAVCFAGPRPHAEVAGHLRSCRVAVVPSIQRQDGRAEGMPSVVLEALAAGARLVATATGGIPDLVRHGENGWLCRDRDPQDLAEKILCALDDAPDSGVPGRARQTVQRHDWPRVAERYHEAFEGLSDA
jgi:glycosyltransferase involved in cell wall biosynthesis